MDLRLSLSGIPPIYNRLFIFNIEPRAVHVTIGAGSLMHSHLLGVMKTLLCLGQELCGNLTRSERPMTYFGAIAAPLSI